MAFPLQAHRGGASLNGIGNELKFFKIDQNSFCYSWFRLQSIAIHCNRRGCRQEHLTRDFSHAPCTYDHTHIVAQGVSGAQSFHPHAIHHVTCLSVRCWSSFCLPFFISHFYLFSFKVFLSSVRHTSFHVVTAEG